MVLMLAGTAKKKMKMNKFQLALSLIGWFFLCLTIGYMGYKIYELARTTEQLNEQLQEANLEIGKGRTVISQRDISIKDLSSELQKVLKENKELVTKYNAIVALYNSHGHGTSGQTGTNNPPINSTNPIYEKGNIYLAISKNDILNFKPPVKFNFQDYHLALDMNLLSKNDFLFIDIDYSLKLKLSIKQIETISPTGAKNNYIELYELDENDKEINKLTLSKFESIIKDDRINHFIWWTPHLDLGISTYFNSSLNYGPSIGFSPSGYGLDNQNLMFKFINLSFIFSENPTFALAPVQWNFSKNIPLINNLWLSPFITYNFIHLGGGLSLSVEL